MLLVASRVTARDDHTLQSELTVVNKREAMSRVVAVSVIDKAGHAEIIVLAVKAGDHLGFIVLCQIVKINQLEQKQNKVETYL